MQTPANNATVTETAPAVQPIPLETMPENPNDPFGVRRELIEEIEEIGRRHAKP